jgi:hypothetical protein
MSKELALTVPNKPSVEKGLKQIAEWYFLVHSDNLEKIGVDQIIVCDDGEIFYDNLKGATAAINYCRSEKIGSKQFKNPL